MPLPIWNKMLKTNPAVAILFFFLSAPFRHLKSEAAFHWFIFWSPGNCSMTLQLPCVLMATTFQPSGFFLPTDLGERGMLNAGGECKKQERMTLLQGQLETMLKLLWTRKAHTHTQKKIQTENGSPHLFSGSCHSYDAISQLYHLCWPLQPFKE